MTSDRYKIVYRSRLALDAWTADRWDLLHKKFPRLILTQGVRSGAAASAGTHRGLGVVDFYLNGEDWRAVLKYAFEIGFFGWMRPALNGYWKQHVHLGVRNHPEMAASLKAQQTSWINRRNGLKGNGPDFFTWRPGNYKQTAPYGKPPKPSKPWFEVAFVNTHGDDGGIGTKTFSHRLPDFVRDITVGSPTIIGFCEVRNSQQELLRKEMVKRKYAPIITGHRMALYRQRSSKVTVKRARWYQYKTQNKGALEGMLRASLVVNGSTCQIGVTHLDYRNGFDMGRVRQMDEGWKSLRRFLVRADWRKRTVIMGDFNSAHWVMDKSLTPAGFVDAGCGASIDFITVGARRPIRSARKYGTKSDHPIIRAELGRY